MTDPRSPLRWLLWLLALPWSLAVAWPLVLLLRTFAAQDLRWQWPGILTATWRPWVRAHWRYSTTLGHAMVLHPEHAAGAILAHELVHVRQAEDEALRAFVGAVAAVLATGSWLFAGAWWATSYAHLATNFLAAILRGGRVYRDAEHERSAYAQSGTGEWRTHGPQIMSVGRVTHNPRGFPR
jgi:hypothetical protein